VTATLGRAPRPAIYVVWAVGSAALLAGAMAARNAIGTYGLVHGQRTRVSSETEARVLSEIPGIERISLKTADGLSLRGWFAPGSRRAAVVFVHGGGGNRLQLLPEARVLAAHGYGFLVYDSRACGDSDGDLVTWGDRERLDVRAAVDFLAVRPDVDQARIGALGFSIGASSIVVEAADDPRVRAVVLYATWSSLEDEMRQNRAKYGFLSWAPVLFAMRRYGVDVDAIRPIDLVSRLAPRALLMIAGENDRDTPIDVMQRVFRAASAPKELWVEPGAGHGGYLAAAPAEYESRLTTFLGHALDVP
jgi:dipeptidyl aminopeptidase/acylaminoacyl peptidase